MASVYKGTWILTNIGYVGKSCIFSGPEEVRISKKEKYGKGETMKRKIY